MDNLEQNIMDKSMRSVFVGNIPYEATEEKLKDIFSEVGQVLSFKLVFDRETGKPKGYGFCEYRDQETALSAMRNLNGYEIGGRSLRVDNACTEKSRMEMQNLMQQPAVENPYGDPIQADKAPEAISKAVASLPPEQMFELMKQMKLCVQNNPNEARSMLLQNPQLAYALLQAQVVMRIVDPQVACTMLHKANNPPPLLMPSEKPVVTSSVPINMPNTVVPTPVPPPAPTRNDFVPIAPTIINQAPVFAAQDVDLRSLEVRPIDPRLARGGGLGDQDMRNTSLPPQNSAPNMNFPTGPTDAAAKLDIANILSESFGRDPRGNLNSFGNDPRQRPLDPRQQKQIPPPVPVVAPPRPVVPPQPVPMPRVGPVGAGMSPNIGGAGASDQEKAALIMQVLQLSDEQIAMLPPEQRTSILVLKEQIAKSTQR